MNPSFLDSITFADIVHLITTLLLYLALVRIYGGQHKGLTRGDVSEICALVIVISCVQMVFAGKMVPDFLIGAFAAVVTAFIVNATVERRAKVKPGEPVPPPSNVGEPLPERNSDGFVRPSTLLLTLGVSVTLLLGAALLTGCASVNGGESRDAKAALAKAGELSALLPDAAVSDPKAKLALSTLRKVTGQDAPAPSAPAGQLVSDGYFDLAGNPLENGVRRVKTYRAIEEIAQPVAIENRKAQIANFQTVPPAAEPSVPTPSSGASVSSGAGGANSLPPPAQVRNSSTTGPQGSAQAPATGGTSSIATARLVQVEARIVAVESPLAAEVSNATAIIELLLTSDLRPLTSGLLVSGRVIAITNTTAAAQLDFKRLHFADVTASVSEQELTTATSEPGAEIQFEASLDADGNLRATAVPAAGSPASLFFQRLEISGRPLLNQYGVVITNDLPRENAESAETEGILKSVRWAPFPKVAFDAPVIETWPREGDKGVCAQLFLNGRKVEWIAHGRQWSTIHNALPVPVKDEEGKVIGYTRGKYFQDLKSGDIVTISIADLNGKNESNRKELVVP